MKIETGNLDVLRNENPEKKGWIIGSFISKESLMYSNNCEVKWAYHLKGTKKTSGNNLDVTVRTIVILISGKWLTRFLDNDKEVILSIPGDYLTYEGAWHENEALEDSQVIVIRWNDQ